MHPDDGTRQAVAASDELPPSGFESFYSAECRLLMRYLMLIGASFEEAEDAVEEGMIDIMRRWPQVQDETISSPYLYVRKAAYRSFVRTRERDRDRLPRTIAGGHAVPEHQADTRMEECEDQQWVDQMLSLLPAAQRSVMELTMEGLNAPQVGELLGKSPGAVRKNLQFARDRLARELDQERRKVSRPAYLRLRKGSS